MGPLGGGSLPEVSDDVAGHHDRKSEVGLEEVLGCLPGSEFLTGRRDGDIGLSNEYKNDEDETDPGPPDAEHGAEG